MLPSRRIRIEGEENHRNQLFRDALARGEEAACRKLLHELVAEGAAVSEAAQRLITDAMHGVGKAWDRQQIDVYQERRACEIAVRLIGELRNSLPEIDRCAPVAVGGAPQGDPYQLPSSLVELTLREAGWNATSLGNDLPLRSFVQAAADCRPKLVWMSVSAIENVDSFVAAQTAMADELGSHVALIVGGRALTAAIRPRLRYTAYCDSLRNLAELAAMLRNQADSARDQASARNSPGVT